MEVQRQQQIWTAFDGRRIVGEIGRCIAAHVIKSEEEEESDERAFAAEGR